MTRRSCEYCSAAASDEPPPATMVLPDDMLARVARSAGEERNYGTNTEQIPHGNWGICPCAPGRSAVASLTV